MTSPRSRVLAAFVALVLLGAWAMPPADAGHGNVLPLLDVDYVKAQYDKGRRLTPIDLRSADDFRRGHLPGARSVPLAELPARFQEVPTADLVVLYCDCPVVDLEDAYQFLRRQRYRNLSLLTTGFKAWAQRGYPIEP